MVESCSLNVSLRFLKPFLSRFFNAVIVDVHGFPVRSLDDVRRVRGGGQLIDGDLQALGVGVGAGAVQHHVSHLANNIL